jgi:hypothetical protein
MKEETIALRQNMNGKYFLLPGKVFFLHRPINIVP